MANKRPINKVDRTHFVVGDNCANDSEFVDASPAERFGFVWELTAEAYSLKGNFDAEQRLQRNVAKLIRP